MDVNEIIVAFNIRNINRRKVTYLPDVTKLSDVFREDDIINDTDIDGNPLPDEQWQLLDSGGNVLLEGRDEIEAKTGSIDHDDYYGRCIVKRLGDCNNEENEALYQAYLSWDLPNYGEEAEELKDYIVNKKGLTRIHGIKFYPANIEVSTSKGVTSFSFDGFDDKDEAFEAWEGWCDDVADIDPVSKDKFEYDVKNHFSLIF